MMSEPLPAPVSSWWDKVYALLADMDRAYDEVAAAVGFVCNGCGDNCCRTLFFHHTATEILVLAEGFAALEERVQDRVLQRAAAYKRTLQAHDPDVLFRLDCPLMEKGRCLLYAFRPMTCRLHGVAWSFTMPDKSVRQGPGCSAFETLRRARGGPARDQAARAGATTGHGKNQSAPILDRTPFYRQLATLESRYRAHALNVPKIRMTVADMLLSPTVRREA